MHCRATGRQIAACLVGSICALATDLLKAGVAQKLPVIETVLVTAQRREQPLEEVPISVAVLDSEQLRLRGIDTLAEIGANVPNLYVNPPPNNPTSVRMFVRGIGQIDLQLTQDPSVAIYMDGVYVGTSIGAGFEGVEIERIEVLRGPQGTLYGRNATGGAINIITRRAETEEWSFGQDVTIGNLGVFESETVLNAPIGSSAAIKFNYFHSQRDHLVENSGVGEGFGMKEHDSLVVDARYTFTETLQLDYRYERARGDNSQRFEQVTRIEDAPGSSLTTITQWGRGRRDDVRPFRDIARNNLEIDAHSLFVSWQFSNTNEVRSISSWRDLDNHYFSDPLSTSVFGAGTAPAYSVSQVSFRQISQEFQLLGAIGPVEYVAGLYGYDDESSQDEDGSAILGIPRLEDFASADNQSLAVYGEATWIPAWMDRRWQLMLGGRYTKDRREAFRANANAGLLGDYDGEFRNFTPTITVGFDLGDEARIYGKIARGYKSGGTSQRSANAELFARGFDEEEVLSYELGYKGDFLQRRARFNMAAFYMELDNFQASVQTGASPGERDFLPIDGNTIKGVEMDATVLLSPLLSASLGYAYLDTQLGEDAVESTAGIFEFTDGLANAPRHSLTAALDLTRPVPGGTLGLHLHYTYQDDVYSSINAIESTRIGGYGLWGAAASWTEISLGSAPGELELMLWGRNLGDEDYGLVSLGAWSFFGASEVVTFGDPRSYGFTLGYRY